MRHHLWFVILSSLLGITAVQTPIKLGESSIHQLITGAWGYAYMVTWNPNGQQLALATDAGLWLFERLDAAPIRMGSNDVEVISVAWNRDGLRLASGDEHGLLLIWDMNPNSPSYLNVIETLQDSGTIHYIDWNPVAGVNQIVTRTETLFAPSSDSVLIITDVRVWSLDRRHIERHYGEIANGSAEAVLSSDGEFLASAGVLNDGRWHVYIWDETMERLVITSEGILDPFRSLAWHPTRNILAHADGTSYVEIYDAESDINVSGFFADIWWITSIKWIHQGNHLSIASRSGDLLVLDPFIGEVIYETNLSGEIRNISWSEEVQALALVVDERDVFILDLSN